MMSRSNFTAFRRIRPLIVVTAELTGLLTLIGTLGSVWFNSIRFRAWDLNFLEIATPGDILMSGLQVAALAWIFLLVTAVFAVVTIIPVLAFRLVPVSNRARRIVLFLGFLACTAALSFWMNSGFLPAFLSMAAAGGVLAYFALHVGKLDERPHLNLPLLLILCGALVYLVVQAIERQARFGGHDDRFAVAVSDAQDDLCPSLMTVRWIGTQSVIVSCDGRWPANWMVQDRNQLVITDKESAKEIALERLVATVGDRPGADFAWTDLGVFDAYDHRGVGRMEVRDFIASNFREQRGNVRRVWMAREYARPWTDGTVRETALVEVDCHRWTTRVVDFTDIAADGQVRVRRFEPEGSDRRQDYSSSSAIESLHLDVICRSYDAGPAERALPLGGPAR